MPNIPSRPALSPQPKRVFMLGATGTIGKATVGALMARGHSVTCFVRPRNGDITLPDGVQVRYGDVTNPASIVHDGFGADHFDAVVSCLASRTGAPKDAWAIDHKAHVDVLSAAQQAGVTQMVLLSAICVQRPLLGFQQAKLAFESALIASGVTYSIVRATAFFKSLSGQIDRVRQGKPFLVFGDGRLTACKPISDADLGAFLADCLDDTARWNRIMPIGGPGPAISPLEQADQLFGLLGQTPKVKQVPLLLLDAIIALLSLLGRVVPKLRDKAELARIGRYYATESMLVLDPMTGLYNADATPESGTDTLFDFYARVLRGEARVDRGDHAVF